MRLFFKLAMFIAGSSLFISTGGAARIYRTFEHYTISGTTAKQLDEAIMRNGPFLGETGNRHPGASRISFDPHIKLEKDRHGCRVKTVSIDVRATISLPYWKQRRHTSDIELAVIWDVLSRDIRQHEESHVIIARSHASQMEQALRTMRSRPTCEALEHDVAKTLDAIFIRHDMQQRNFDRIETRNYKNRFNRLLERRLQNVLIFKGKKKYRLDFS
ncbi:MAG: Hypothetical protein BHV28_09090 [Candidatus Tokpelaia hoelldobleri]|uniref:Secreted Zn-dependent protease n=1 Tax=Candidatus Tokpelaia hoelldobleri TaxID=1902579 RepID=A0A1U9JUP0_9HYPH|nr:MAG: Hypothetical protein BHV28_09090 [Candidatus Tokpelaia hoelldoblerii]